MQQSRPLAAGSLLLLAAILASFCVEAAKGQLVQTFYMDRGSCTNERNALSRAPIQIDSSAIIYSHLSPPTATSLMRNNSSSTGAHRRQQNMIPPGTSDYPANIDCQQHLVVAVHWRIMFRFEYLDIACSASHDDAVYVFDGGSSFAKPWTELGGQKGLCGSPSGARGNNQVLGRRFNTTDMYMTIAFKTGGKLGTRRAGKGFKIIATAITECPPPENPLPASSLIGAQSWTMYQDVGLFRCSNSICLRLSLRCDGIDHCGDGSDEADCSETIGDIPQVNPPILIPPSRGVNYGHIAAMCPSAEPQRHKIPVDGRFFTVEEYTNGVFLYRCRNGLCINATYLCNRANNCGDESDEISCPDRDRDRDRVTSENQIELERDAEFNEGESPVNSTSRGDGDDEDNNFIAKFLKLGVAATLAIACGTIIALGAIVGTTICLCMKRLKGHSADDSSDGSTHVSNAPPGYQQVAMQAPGKCPSFLQTPTHQRRVLSVYPSGGSLSGTDVTQHTGSSTQNTMSNSATNGIIGHSPYHVMYPAAGRSTISKKSLHNWNSFTTNETGIGTGITHSSPSPSSSYVIAPGLIYQPAKAKTNTAGSSTSSSVTATNASAPSGLMPLLTKRRNRHGSNKQFKLCHLDLPKPRRSTMSLRSKASSSSNERAPLALGSANTSRILPLSVNSGKASCPGVHVGPLSAGRQILSNNLPLINPSNLSSMMNGCVPGPCPGLSMVSDPMPDCSADVIDENEDEDKSSGVSLAMSETTKTTVIHQGVRQHPDCGPLMGHHFNDYIMDERRRSGVIDVDNDLSSFGLGVPLPPAPMPAELLITSSTNENLSLTMRLARNLNLQQSASGV